MAVWLSEKMTFPVLLRSSAIAGMFMFIGAFLLASLVGITSIQLHPVLRPFQVALACLPGHSWPYWQS